MLATVGMDPAQDPAEAYVFEDERLPLLVFGALSLVSRGAEVEIGGGSHAESAPGWIHELFVDAPHRGRGVAARLLAESDAFFAARGAKKVSVRVESSNSEALEYWGRRGFGERARILERVS